MTDGTAEGTAGVEWTEWPGGTLRPEDLRTDAMVEVRLRDDPQPTPSARPAWQWRWSHVGDGTDVVAYRTVPPLS